MLGLEHPPLEDFEKTYIWPILIRKDWAMADVGISDGMILQHVGTPAEVAAFFALIERNRSEAISGALDLVTDVFSGVPCPASSMTTGVEKPVFART